MMTTITALRARWARIWTRQTVETKPGSKKRSWLERLPTNGLLALSALVIWATVYLVYIR